MYRFIYTLFIAIDANFRLKRRAVSNETRDPALGTGQGYFVHDERYRRYLLGMTDKKDVSNNPVVVVVAKIKDNL